MKKLFRPETVLLIGACLFTFSTFATTQLHSTVKTEKQKKKTQMEHANGTFEVDLAPLEPDEGIENPAVNRMRIVKQFTGDLKAESQGQMLSFRSTIKGSAGYVALERVTGTLDGHRGSFVLQHNGIMNRGKPQLSVIVVPDSGTDELVGLEGTMTIKIENGKHYYEFEYNLMEHP